VATLPSQTFGRPPLPRVLGLTAEEVQAFIGQPAYTLTRPRGVTVWYYPTPSGTQQVLMVRNASAGGAGLRATELVSGNKTPTLATLPASCEVQMAPISVTTRYPSVPAFTRAQFGPAPVAAFEAGAVLSVLERTGSWFLIRFNDRRWGERRAYVHCTDVEVRSN
jgi:hypothetical protein